MRKLAFPVLLLFTLTACWNSKQQMYSTVVNQSGSNLRAIEVAYPGGSYGVPQMKPAETNRKWLAITPPCTYSVQFEDEKGKQHQSKQIEFGKDKCPAEIVLTIDTTMSVTGAAK